MSVELVPLRGPVRQGVLTPHLLPRDVRPVALPPSMGHPPMRRQAVDMRTHEHPTTRTTRKHRRRCATRVLVLAHPRCRTLAPTAAGGHHGTSAARHRSVVTGVATVALVSSVGLSASVGPVAATAPPRDPQTAGSDPHTAPATTAAAVGTVTARPRKAAGPTAKPKPPWTSASPSPTPVNPGPVAFEPGSLFTSGPLRSPVTGWSVDPGSAAAVARLSDLNLVVSLRQWTVAVHGAAPDTVRTDVALTNTWGTGLTRLEGVPMPAGVLPDPAGDGHLTVVQPSTGCVYDLFRARTVDGAWVADWANAITADSSGIYPDGMGTRAAGFSAALGLIWPEEIERGRIDHALVFAYPHTSSSWVAPATRTDGRTTTAGALPIGARLRLDPSLDLSTLGLSRTERIIARALQEYGMVLGDTSGGFTLYAAHPRGLGQDPYPSLFGTTSDWASLARIPQDRFQVLTLSPPPPRTSYRTACATLR